MQSVDKPTLFGRSSSHFTRVARVFAAEHGVAYDFVTLKDLTSLDPADYGGNPALKLPTLRTPRGTWFGSLNVCRELARLGDTRLHVVWPEDLTDPLAASAQELTVHGMATGVALIMGKPAAGTEPSKASVKAQLSLTNTLAWLESNVDAALGLLPAERDLSFLEVSLFCMMRHLAFREVLPVEGYARLQAFCSRYEGRPAIIATTFQFDA